MFFMLFPLTHFASNFPGSTRQPLFLQAPPGRVRGMLAMSKLAALAAAGDSLSSAAALKVEALRVRDRRLAMMSVQARSPR